MPRRGHQSLTLEIDGPDLSRLDGEAGGHRLQRVPPSERSGRVHSSMVTVALLDPGAAPARGPFDRRADSDFRLEWFNGTIKAGGQHHQKNATCLRLIHLPTGLVQTAQSRSRQASEKLARAAMATELDRRSEGAEAAAANRSRTAQIGTGDRAGGKCRTWRFQQDRVLDHKTGRKARASQVMSGRFDLLWS